MCSEHNCFAFVRPWFKEHQQTVLKSALDEEHSQWPNGTRLMGNNQELWGIRSGLRCCKKHRHWRRLSNRKANQTRSCLLEQYVYILTVINGYELDYCCLEIFSISEVILFVFLRGNKQTISILVKSVVYICI